MKYIYKTVYKIFLLYKIRIIITIKGELINNMKKQKQRLFNYTKLVTDIQKESKKSQEELSVDLDCTASHISNVKNGKSKFSLDKTLQLLNKYEYCIEDYLESENKMKRYREEEYKEWKQGIDVELLLLLLAQIEIMIKFNHEKTEEKSQHLVYVERIKKISENIYHLRIERGISIKEMCKQLNVKETTYQNIENGSNRTTIDNYAHIAKILNVPLTLLLNDSLKNKEALVDYRLEKIFSKMNFIEKREMKKMMGEVLEVFKKYKK